MVNRPAMAIGVAVGVAATALLTLAMGQAAEQAPAGDGDFGRWETLLGRCQLQWPPAGTGAPLTSGCLSMRLDQTIEGMLRVRFINGAAGSRFASEELSFAGLLLRQDQPMRCEHGACQPSWPLRLVVQGVATRRFDSRGLAAQLPSNQLARGSCRLDAQQVQCDAESRQGQRWLANAQLRSAPGDNGNARQRP